MALTAGLGALLGAKNSSLSNRTTTGSAFSTPGYTGTQTGLQDDLYGALSKSLASPGADLAPIRAASTDAINNTYSGMSDRMTQFLAQRGFGSSGTQGFNQQQIESQRAGAISKNEDNLDQLGIDDQHQTLRDALDFAFKNPGNTSGFTNVAPGNTGAGALSGGLAALFQSINQGLQAGGGD